MIRCDPIVMVIRRNDEMQFTQSDKTFGNCYNGQDFVCYENDSEQI